MCLTSQLNVNQYEKINKIKKSTTKNSLNVCVMMKCQQPGFTDQLLKSIKANPH